MRLDKLLAHAGFGTRKEVKKLIQSEMITVNNQVITKPEYQVNPDTDEICYMNQRVDYQEFYYVMLNKPAGIVCATEDSLYETVIDWVHLDYGHVSLFPVGRLDIDTTGLLLLTNNGQLAHQLTSPRKDVAKTYRAVIAEPIKSLDIEQFANGIRIDDYITKPAELRDIQRCDAQGYPVVEVTIYEGKYHQVKRMFESIGNKVIQLHRISMGPIELDHMLEVGAYRPLSEDEKQLLIPYGLK